MTTEIKETIQDHVEYLARVKAKADEAQLIRDKLLYEISLNLFTCKEGRGVDGARAAFKARFLPDYE